MARTKETEVKEFAGLVTESDDFDIGAVAAVILTNFTLTRSAQLATRPGYVLVQFESET